MEITTEYAINLIVNQLDEEIVENNFTHDLLEFVFNTDLYNSLEEEWGDETVQEILQNVGRYNAIEKGENFQMYAYNEVVHAETDFDIAFDYLGSRIYYYLEDLVSKLGESTTYDKVVEELKKNL